MDPINGIVVYKGEDPIKCSDYKVERSELIDILLPENFKDGILTGAIDPSVIKIFNVLKINYDLFCEFLR